MAGQRLCVFRFVLVLAVGAPVLLAGGCGGSSKQSNTTAAAASSTSATAPATTTTAPASSGASGSGGLSADAVAVAAGTPITQAAFDHWLTVATKATASAKTPAIDPSDPPGFSKCIAEVRQKEPSLAHESDKQLRADCSLLFKTLSAEVMDFLITADWYQAYAARLKLVPSSQDVTTALNTEKAQTFPTGAKFRAFLAQEGETVADVRFRVLISLIAQKLVAKQKGTQSARQTAVQSEVKKAFFAGTVCTPTVAMADCSNYNSSG
jgi:hypothetical protein